MKTKTMRYALGLVAALIATSTVAQNNYALGPVESSSSRTDVVVLGQRFSIDAATRCSIGARVVSGRSCTAALSAGAYIVVEGDQISLGRASVITVLPYSYVPGASTVMLGARVSAVQAELGIVRLGNLAIDETALFSYGSISHQLGAYLEVAGIQPSANGTVLATGIRFNVSGSGVQTIAGPSAQAITGTGILTYTGSGIQAITGTGIQAITGTGTAAITGTGVDAITGTGTEAITGTGTAAITGTGVDAITGTGTQAITGTGTEAITGTGVQMQAITGTGVQLQAITGTGKQAQAQAITGTGKQVQTQAITGTGTQAITGTGVQMQAITGTGVQLQAITGTGEQAQVQAITGTGSK